MSSSSPSLPASPAADLFTTFTDGVLTITFNRPHARNAFTKAMYAELEAVLRAVPQRPDVRALIFTGAGGKAFASGTDLAELQQIATPAQAMAYEKGGEVLFGLIENCPVPTLAAIDGVCVGGGLAIAAASDLRLASAGARIGMPIARTSGNCLSLASCRLLASLVGPARVKHMIFTAELWSAEQAQRFGFVDEVVTDAPSVLPRAQALAAQIASHAPLTLRAAKSMLQLLRDGGNAQAERAIIEQVYTSNDFAEGVAAFLAKRKPHWTGT